MQEVLGAACRICVLDKSYIIIIIPQAPTTAQPHSYPCSGVLWNVWKGQDITMHASPTARKFVFANFWLPKPFNFIFPIPPQT